MKEKYLLLSYSSNGTFLLATKTGTEAEAADALNQIIQADRKAQEEQWDIGTENKGELTKNGIGLAGFNTFRDFSVNYYMCPIDKISELNLEKRLEQTQDMQEDLEQDEPELD